MTAFRIKLFLLFAFLSLGIGGCATRVEYVMVTPTIVAPPQPRGISWKPVDIRRETDDRYVMNGNSRSNLVDNLADTHRYIDQQQAVIQFYKKETANEQRLPK